MKIKTGDNVRIMSGADKGKTGKVTQVFPALERVVVEGVNLRKRHLAGRKGGGRAGQNIPGQIVEFASPIRASNVAIVGKSGKTGRVGVKTLVKDGVTTKVRVLRSKKNVEDLE